MGMGRISCFSVVHGLWLRGATRRCTYLLVSDRGRFGGLRSGGTRLGCAGQFRLPSGVPLMGDRRGMGEGNGAGRGPRDGRRRLWPQELESGS